MRWNERELETFLQEMVGVEAYVVSSYHLGHHPSPLLLRLLFVQHSMTPVSHEITFRFGHITVPVGVPGVEGSPSLVCPSGLEGWVSDDPEITC